MGARARQQGTEERETGSDGVKRGIYQLDRLPVSERTKVILRRHRFTRYQLRCMSDAAIERATNGKLGRRSIQELRYALTPGRW
jgi:hypothetical protein